MEIKVFEFLQIQTQFSSIVDSASVWNLSCSYYSVEFALVIPVVENLGPQEAKKCRDTIALQVHSLGPWPVAHCFWYLNKWPGTY